LIPSDCWQERHLVAQVAHIIHTVDDWRHQSRSGSNHDNPMLSPIDGHVVVSPVPRGPLNKYAWRTRPHVNRV
jgi:hypothetical protein